MRDPGSRGRSRDAHRPQELTGAEDRLIGTDEEIGEGDPAAVVLDLGVDREQERCRVRMRVREAEVAAQRPHVAHADVGHVRSIAANAGSRSSTSGERSISRCVAVEPITSAPFLARMPPSSSIPFTSTRCP